MTDSRKVEAEKAPGTEPAKRPWASPTIEEIDFRAASFGGGAYNPGDINTYNS